jgi:hypothetical protein
VAKFGTQEYAFALDYVPSEAEIKEELKAKEEAKKAEQEAEKKRAEKQAEKAKSESQSPASESTLGKVLDALDEAVAESKEKSATKKKTVYKATVYNRFYFDQNHNGDLTDDPVIEATSQNPAGRNQPMAMMQFPVVEVKLDVAEAPVDYAFSLVGHSNASANFSFLQLQISPAVYRSGDITLNGKSHHIDLIDFNSNGRFDDEIKISENIHFANGQVYPEQGDMLLIDFDPKNPTADSPYDVTSSDKRQHVSKLVQLDDQFYDLKISPAGDHLSLTPSTLPLGNITNPNKNYRALIYGAHGFVRISDAEGKPVPVPEGDWKLLSYTIDLSSVPEPAKPEAKPEAKAGETKADEAKTGDAKTEEAKATAAAAKALATAKAAAGIGKPVARVIRSIVSARGTSDCKPVKVVKGETVEFPFGPPYSPTVKASPMYAPPTNASSGGKQQLSLEMSLIGSAGEICSNMIVENQRPSAAKFTITDQKGEVVQQGTFEYG